MLYSFSNSVNIQGHLNTDSALSFYLCTLIQHYAPNLLCNRQISVYIDTREIMEVAEHNGTAVFAELPAPIKPYRQVSRQSATLHIGNVSIDIYSGMDAELLKTLLEAVKLC